MSDAEYLSQMLFWYLVTIAVETAILVVALSPRHPMKHRIFAGAWLTACTYPIVWLVLPSLITNRAIYLWVAETFAPVAECLLFWIAYGNTEPRTRAYFVRDMLVIIVANLASFGAGVQLQRWGVDGWQSPMG